MKDSDEKDASLEEALRLPPATAGVFASPCVSVSVPVFVPVLVCAFVCISPVSVLSLS